MTSVAEAYQRPSADGRIDVEAAVAALTEGPGYVVWPGLYDSAMVSEARQLTYHLAETEEQRVFHFVPDEARETQKRVWNLIDKGAVFRHMAADDRLLAVLAGVLGSDVALASYAANVLHPGAPAQEPHADYPFWDLYATDRWPRGAAGMPVIQVETVTMLDAFTKENGATWLVPGSFSRGRWPSADGFEHEAIQVEGPPGTVLAFSATGWHAGGANRSQASRAGLLGCYTMKFVKPIEDYRRCLRAETVRALSDTERRLLALDYPYPAVMDERPPENEEGVRAATKESGASTAPSDLVGTEEER
jgi:ectoine hydroxylase-related dioxygenase (phytanoyl-CoA dioxygenase family)